MKKHASAHLHEERFPLFSVMGTTTSQSSSRQFKHPCKGEFMVSIAGLKPHDVLSVSKHEAARASGRGYLMIDRFVFGFNAKC